jgi:hypothetical protein
LINVVRTWREPASSRPVGLVMTCTQTRTSLICVRPDCLMIRSGNAQRASTSVFKMDCVSSDVQSKRRHLRRVLDCSSTRRHSHFCVDSPKEQAIRQVDKGFCPVRAMFSLGVFCLIHTIAVLVFWRSFCEMAFCTIWSSVLRICST